VKKGKVNVESVIKSVDTLMPDEMKEDTKRAISLCKDAGAGAGKDFCENAFRILTCMLKENPSFYFP
jgi:hypothetical protein